MTRPRDTYAQYGKPGPRVPWGWLILMVLAGVLALLAATGTLNRWFEGLFPGEPVVTATIAPTAATLPTPETREMTLPSLSYICLQMGVFSDPDNAASAAGDAVTISDGDRYRLVQAVCLSRTEAETWAGELAALRGTEPYLHTRETGAVTLLVTGLPTQVDAFAAGTEALTRGFTQWDALQTRLYSGEIAPSQAREEFAAAGAAVQETADALAAAMGAAQGPPAALLERLQSLARSLAGLAKGEDLTAVEYFDTVRKGFALEIEALRSFYGAMSASDTGVSSETGE